MIYNPESFVKYRDLPNLNTMFGNIGHSWNNLLPNDLYIKGLPKVINTDFSTVNSAGAGPDTLHTFSIPAETLKAGDLLDVVYGGNTAANDNNKFLQTEFDGLTIEATGGTDIDDAVGWIFLMRIGIIDSTHIVAVSSFLWNALAVDSPAAIFTTFAAGFMAIGRNRLRTVANMDSNAMVLRVRAGGVVAADIFQNYSEIRLTRF